MIVYKTTNLVNGKFYIGQTSGSGNGFYGKNHSESTKKTISKFAKINSLGENNSFTKLTNNIVSEIKECIFFLKLNPKDISTLFGITLNIVYQIKSGKSWKHI